MYDFYAVGSGNKYWLIDSNDAFLRELNGEPKLKSYSGFWDSSVKLAMFGN